MRINKYIAHAGVASRRKAEELIKEGCVTLNGKTVTELATIVKNGDIVEVDGSPIYNEEKVYYLLNKYSVNHDQRQHQFLLLEQELNQLKFLILS